MIAAFISNEGEVEWHEVDPLSRVYGAAFGIYRRVYAYELDFRPTFLQEPLRLWSYGQHLITTSHRDGYVPPALVGLCVERVLAHAQSERLMALPLSWWSTWEQETGHYWVTATGVLDTEASLVVHSPQPDGPAVGNPKGI